MATPPMLPTQPGSDASTLEQSGNCRITRKVLKTLVELVFSIPLTKKRCANSHKPSTLSV